VRGKNSIQKERKSPRGQPFARAIRQKSGLRKGKMRLQSRSCGADAKSQKN
jgi:hypothetical protein